MYANKQIFHGFTLNKIRINQGAHQKAVKLWGFRSGLRASCGGF